ncbi:phage tail protein [Beijerinckia mobilis]|uniref:phage tail protein n=1 Tax=Beijerinckia mobilis TaxID=231434 RepID=UPI00068E2300|nr:phage tail protein [Beijerinckia mobilis]
MTLPTFNPPTEPTIGLENKPEIKLLKADFGDGYTQSSPDGLNHIRKVINLTWDVLYQDDCAEILNFFNERAGYLPFYYQLPDETQPTKYTCEEWSDKYIQADYRSVAATFRQSFTLEI